MSNPTEERPQYYFKQNFAFSTNYLNDDWKIPDFRGRIVRAVPLLVLPTGVILDVKLQVLQANALHELIQSTLADDNVFVCNDAVLLHRLALRQAGDSEEHREMIWSLTDRHALWDVCLLEQRIIWGTEGRAIERPDFESLLDRYQVPKETLPPEGLRQVLIAQFDHLVDNLPFLMNDLVGRRIFDPDPPATTIIPAPTRVLARDVDYRERLHIFMPLIEGWMHYGPACIGIDVQGTIAKYYLDQQDRQMPPDSQQRFDSELRRLRNTLHDFFGKRYYAALQRDRGEDDKSQEKVHKLEQEVVLRHWNKAFDDRRDFNEPLESVMSSTQDQVLEKLFEYIHEGDEKFRSAFQIFLKQSQKNDRKLKYSHDTRFSQRHRRFPLDENGAVSLNPDHWSESIPLAGPLRGWADCRTVLKASKLDDRFAHADFPYLKSGVAEYAERYGIPLLSTSKSSGRVLLEFRIRDIDLLSYLRTHLDTDFIYKDGRGEPLTHFRRFSDCPEELLTRTEWYRNDLVGSPAFSELEGGERIGHRILSNAMCCRDFWAASSYFAASRFFERSQEERDSILATIVLWVYGHIVKQENHLLLDVPTDCREKLFQVLTRLSVKGLLRDFSDEMIAEQVRAFDNIFPKNIERVLLLRHIEIIQKILLYSSRFRDTLGSNVLNTILSKLCIDPVCYTEGLGEYFRLDDKWRECDHLRYYVDNSMTRDAINEITDYNQLYGGQDDRRHFDYFLQPLIEERCRMLEIDPVEPSQNLVDRLMLTNAISCNGKPGRPVYEFEIPYTSWMESLDDLKKSIAYSIVRHCTSVDGALVAVSCESFIVDAERGAAETVKTRLSFVIRKATEHALGLEVGEFGNFVEVTNRHVP